MKIVVEIDSIEELKTFLNWRDRLRDRISELEQTPLKFSLRQLAFDVTDGMKSLTPDQAQQIRDLIEGTKS